MEHHSIEKISDIFFLFTYIVVVAFYLLVAVCYSFSYFRRFQSVLFNEFFFLTLTELPRRQHIDSNEFKNEVGEREEEKKMQRKSDRKEYRNGIRIACHL